MDPMMMLTAFATVMTVLAATLVAVNWKRARHRRWTDGSKKSSLVVQNAVLLLIQYRRRLALASES